MLITKKYLDQYIYIESYIKSISRRLKYYEEHPLKAVHGIVCGSTKSYPYIKCNLTVSGSDIKSGEERNRVISQLIMELQQNKRLYEGMKIDIECFIEGLDDLEYKTILRLKYIDRKTDQEIGDELGYDRSTIAKKINKILDIGQLSHNSH